MKYWIQLKTMLYVLVILAGSNASAETPDQVYIPKLGASATAFIPIDYGVKISNSTSPQANNYVGIYTDCNNAGTSIYRFWHYAKYNQKSSLIFKIQQNEIFK